MKSFFPQGNKKIYFRILSGAVLTGTLKVERFHVCHSVCHSLGGMDMLSRETTLTNCCR